MKKYFTITILLIAMVLCLCSCAALDNMKKSHAKLDNGNIIYKENTYIPLPECKDIFNLNLNTKIKLTENDVPVLLSSLMGISAYTNKDEVLIFTYSDPESEYASYPDLIYCREDKYAELLEKIKNHTFDNYLINYQDFDYENYSILYKTYLLTEEEKNAINAIISEVQPSETNIYYESWISSISIYKCSEDMLFGQYTYEIYEIKNKYFICDTMSSDKIKTYEVPDKYKDIISVLMKYSNNYEEYPYYEVEIYEYPA